MRPFPVDLFAVVGASEGKVSLADTYRGIMPFVLIEVILLVAFVAFPQMVTWLPDQMFSH